MIARAGEKQNVRITRIYSDGTSRSIRLSVVFVQKDPVCRVAECVQAMHEIDAPCQDPKGHLIVGHRFQFQLITDVIADLEEVEDG